MTDMSYLKDKPIAVLGAGAVGKAIAGDCALGGAKVRICDFEPFAEKTLKNIEKVGIKFYGDQVNLYGFEREGFAKMDRVTTDVAEAVKGAGIIVIATPTFGHKPFFEKLIPCLEDGQVIHIFPDNFGTLILRKMMREAGCTKNVIVGGWSSSTYGSRVDMPGGVITHKIRVYYRAITLRGAAMPATDTKAFIESSKYLPSMDAVTQGEGAVAGDTVLDTGFSNVNPVLHCPGAILGVSTMENFGTIFGEDKFKFSIYSHAYCPSISQVQYTFYQEECALADTIGVGIQPYQKEHFFSRENVLGQEYMGLDYLIPFDKQDPIQYGTGPFTMENRYITEDIPVGCYVYQQLGDVYGVNTPVVDAMISLACAILGRDLTANGYTLEYIGIDNMNKEELNDYLRTGKIK
ncbi:NAD/NADP octopine/nopaline dehydrogenase family protein [Acetobacterium woodii]|uniref:Opine dehydrogenase Odh n=1 Tax=Acetobacterium woodii (strain ATCC 29683 / DSM 1030 / JCM 2381 / KCTC 1655 / WB1) TaxID=931626 RepID=H6LG64_ACEWD|nr:NAD/NADP octopine/nopaline dehydrogenase family protein [Acetobacterium woodii]AFA49540.1 opine dehydrogenase Odh [Acetobacterium woodii DSM 1030]